MFTPAHIISHMSQYICGDVVLRSHLTEMVTRNSRGSISFGKILLENLYGSTIGIWGGIKKHRYLGESVFCDCGLTFGW